jgi:hypothetical protein
VDQIAYEDVCRYIGNHFLQTQHQITKLSERALKAETELAQALSLLTDRTGEAHGNTRAFPFNQ